MAVHGLAQADVARVARQSRAAFAARTPGGPDPDRAVDTAELTLGLRHTVIASVPLPASERHLLTVTAQGVSVQVLEAWTRRLADDIHQACPSVMSRDVGQSGDRWLASDGGVGSVVIVEVQPAGEGGSLRWSV